MFSFCASADHRNLHSFPTRRSSDLRSVASGPMGMPGIVHSLLDETDRRSEEHTSELQSQSNVVCRLLLEKKKTAMRAELPATTAVMAVNRLCSSGMQAIAIVSKLVI